MTSQSKEGPGIETADSWLLVVVSTARATSSLRVHVWRKLRSLGALYLQQSVCLLPDRAETSRAVHRLLDRVHREGGNARLLKISLTEPREIAEIVDAFNAERADEYSEVVGRTPAFLEEIEMERSRGRATYAEVEESETDLDRFRAWMSRIRARDYFDASGAAEAEAAIDRCARALAEFEDEALASDAPEEISAPLPKPTRLRTVKEA